MLSKFVLSTLSFFVWIGAASAASVSPTTYSMLNGEDHYFDDTYSGSGSPHDLSPLSGGLGDLIDGIVTSGNWIQVENRQNPGPYVGWLTVDPVITFSFAKEYVFRHVRIHMDDSNNTGGVNPPEKVILSDGVVASEFLIEDPEESAPFWAEFDVANFVGPELEITVKRRMPKAGPLNPHLDSYIMLSEFKFIADDPLVGDTNFDGRIDVADLNAVRNHFGEHEIPGARADGDTYPFNGIVDIGDLNRVRNQFGETSPTPVPEPASVALLAMGVCCAWAGIGRPRQSRGRPVQRL